MRIFEVVVLVVLGVYSFSNPLLAQDIIPTQTIESAELLSTQSSTAPISFTETDYVVHDDQGTLATVDINTGDVSIVGSMSVVMTDIAFNKDGDLFGLTFQKLYSIDPQTAVVTEIGSHGIPNGNALVFGRDGSLYGAGRLSGGIYRIDTTTATSTLLGDTGYSSAGDLTFSGTEVYLASTSGQLVRVDLNNPVNSYVVGAMGVSNVFGIATSAGSVYAVAGTSLYRVNTSTGRLLDQIDFSGQGLSTAYGGSFVGEAGLPAASTIIGPAADNAALQPFLGWNASSRAEWYRVWLEDDSGSRLIYNWYRAEEVACKDGTGQCGVEIRLPASGSFRYWVRTWNSLGNGPWSGRYDFTTSASEPDRSSLLNPIGAIGLPQPTVEFSWTAVANATWYLIWVDSGFEPQTRQWVSAAEANCVSGTEECSFEVEGQLGGGFFGSARWWVQTWNSSGLGPWSEGHTFSYF